MPRQPPPHAGGHTGQGLGHAAQHGAGVAPRRPQAVALFLVVGDELLFLRQLHVRGIALALGLRALLKIGLGIPGKAGHPIPLHPVGYLLRPPERKRRQLVQPSGDGMPHVAQHAAPPYLFRPDGPVGMPLVVGACGRRFRASLHLSPIAGQIHPGIIEEVILIVGRRGSVALLGHILSFVIRRTAGGGEETRACLVFIDF